MINPGDVGVITNSGLMLYPMISLSEDRSVKVAPGGDPFVKRHDLIFIVSIIIDETRPDELVYIIHPNGIGWLESDYITRL